jgi:hypothetical protein
MAEDADGRPPWLPLHQYDNFKRYKEATDKIQKWLQVPEKMIFSHLISAALAKKKEYDDKKLQIPFLHFGQISTAIELRQEVYKYYKAFDGASKERRQSTVSHGSLIQL